MTTKNLKSLVQNQAYQVVRKQLAVVVVLALLASLLVGANSGFSLLMGGLTYCLPNILFVWRVFRYSGAQQMTLFMAAFFAGEMFKLFLSAILFIIVVKTLPVSLLSTLAGYIGAIVAFWFVCMWQFTRTTKKVG